MIGKFELSERHACSLVGLSRDSYRNPPVPDQQTAALSAAIVAIAQARSRFGYRRIHDLLRPEFPQVNHKRIYRLYRAATCTGACSELADSAPADAGVCACAPIAAIRQPRANKMADKLAAVARFFMAAPGADSMAPL